MNDDRSQLNPFCGPATADSDTTIYGRDTALRHLRNLVQSARTVLLYGRAGTGKSSLLNAKNGLIESFNTSDDEGLLVLPSISLADVRPWTRGAHDGVVTLGRKLTEASGNIHLQQPLTATQEAQCGWLDWLSECLASSAPAPPASADSQRAPRRPGLLVLDQLERVLEATSAGSDQPAAASLVLLLGKLLACHPRLHLLLVIQEEFLGATDSVRSFLPNELEFRYRLDKFSFPEIESVLVQLGRRLPEQTLPETVKRDLLKFSAWFPGDPAEDVGSATKAGGGQMPPSLEQLTQQLYEPLLVQAVGRVLFDAYQRGQLDRTRAIFEKLRSTTQLSYKGYRRLVAELFLAYVLDRVQDRCGSAARRSRVLPWLAKNFRSADGRRERANKYRLFAQGLDRLRGKRLRALVAELDSWGVLREQRQLNDQELLLGHDWLLSTLEQVPEPRREGEPLAGLVRWLPTMLCIAVPSGFAIWTIADGAARLYPGYGMVAQAQRQRLQCETEKERLEERQEEALIERQRELAIREQEIARLKLVNSEMKKWLDGEKANSNRCNETVERLKKKDRRQAAGQTERQKLIEEMKDLTREIERRRPPDIRIPRPLP